MGEKNSNIIRNINSDIIFLIGIFLLPFENLFIAPSTGWATITPIIFVIYLMFNVRKIFEIKLEKKITKKIIALVCMICIFNIIAYLINGINLKNIIGAMISIGLGFVNFLSMYIYNEKNKSLKEIIYLILISYTLTLIVGLVQFIAIKLNINIIYNFFNFIFKRNYLRYNRIQFFYTEPSFIGMHLFGILLPIYLISKDRRILYLVLTSCFLSLIFKSGVRIILDIVFIFMIFLVFYIIKKKKYILLFIIPIILSILTGTAYITNVRIKEMIDKGVYADGSLASRFFRIEASIYGYIKGAPKVLIGYGIGNAIIPLKDGYEDAEKKYKSEYRDEVEELGNLNYNDDSVSYCLYIRMISEFGIIVTILTFYYLITITLASRFEFKWPYLITIIYIYLQFESYAFYAIWLFILIMYYTRAETKNIPLKNVIEEKK